MPPSRAAALAFVVLAVAALPLADARAPDASGYFEGTRDSGNRVWWFVGLVVVVVVVVVILLVALRLLGIMPV